MIRALSFFGLISLCAACAQSTPDARPLYLTTAELGMIAPQARQAAAFGTVQNQGDALRGAADAIRAR